MQRSPVRYVTVDGADIAYQSVGDGPQDVLWMYALGGQIDLSWFQSRYASSLERLAAFSRVLVFDRRGSGASDAAPRGTVPNWELFAEDVAAVLEAAGSRRTAIIGSRETGQIAMLYAVMHPEQVSALVLVNSTARFLVAEDHPTGESEETVEALVTLLRERWGSEELSAIVNPGFADPEAVRLDAMLMRASATPSQAAAQYEEFFRYGDVRKILAGITVPTLVLHAEDSPLLPAAHGRFLADHIPGAQYVVLEQGDLGGGMTLQAAQEIETFLTGVRPAEPVERILTTVLFSDIVTSTQLVADHGDRRWRQLLDAHDKLMRTQLRLFRGREVNTTGDGFVAAFDGPGRAILCARAMRDAARELGLELHLGLHTGECEVRGEDLAGITVHIAARVCAHADAGVITVSRTVADLVAGSDLVFDDAGTHELKGVPGSWQLFGVRD